MSRNDLDVFVADCGFASAQLTPETQQALCGCAEAFLRSGLDYKTWQQLGSASRAAFIAANEIIWRERIVILVRAMKDDMAELALIDEEVAKDVLASKALNALIENLDKQETKELST